MTTPDVRAVSDEAVARAKQAHGGVPSGDNDPAATDHLKAVAAAVDILEPRIQRETTGRAMCADWGYDHQPGKQETVKIKDGHGRMVIEYTPPPRSETDLDDAAGGLARLTRRRPTRRPLFGSED